MQRQQIFGAVIQNKLVDKILVAKAQSCFRKSEGELPLRDTSRGRCGGRKGPATIGKLSHGRSLPLRFLSLAVRSLICYPTQTSKPLQGGV
jgi:hypothetical protein